MARVYQAADNRWIVFNNNTKTYFDQQGEAEQMSNKITFAEKAQDISTRLSAVVDEAADLEAVYFDRSYNTGSASITDSDVSSLGIGASDIGAFITLAQQLQNFVSSGSIVQGDYDSTLNRLRTDV